MAAPDFSAAISPCDIDRVPDLLGSIASAGDGLSKSPESMAARLKLLASARKLVNALETPRESMIRELWAQPAMTMAVQFGIRSGLWAKMAENGDRPQKVADLAKQLDVQEELLQRLMRHISAWGYLNMVAPDEYLPNNFTKALANPIVSIGYHAAPQILEVIFQEAEAWFKSHGSVVPTDKYDTPYQLAHKTDLHWFEHVQSIPEFNQGFNEHLFAYFLGRPAWSDDDFYPAKKCLINGFDASDPDAVLLVDLAGGIGHYTEQFRAIFADAPGRMILQELPVVLNSIQGLHPRIEKMQHDMFTEQPVKGARCYYTHFVLHDWSDEDCIKILNNLKPAMTPGYSKLLIHEHVVPPMDQDAEQTALDLIMMTGFASKERSLEQWSSILEKSCGLKIVKVWTFLNGIESVIEVERP